MKFDHRYKLGGVIYEAGQEVPIEDETPKEQKVSVEKKPTHLFPSAEEKPKRKGRPPKAKE